MKRTLPLVLAAIILAVSLASFAPAAPRSAVDPRIAVTSSDAAGAAEWLGERLDEIPGRLVLGTDASEYGVDVSTLADDGYIIRDLGGETAIFARTEGGLDRAVRKYAKMAEAGAIRDVTYREGGAIGKLILAGRDISEYTVYTEDEERILNSANDFAAHVKTACGASLAVSTEAPKAPYIILRYVHDEALRTVGSRWSVDEGGLTIECSDAYKRSSSFYAVRRFLETRLDWYGLVSGFEDLADADVVEIAVGESGEENVCFEWAVTHGGWACLYDRFDNDIQDTAPDRHTCHGMQNNKFAGELSESPNRDWAYDQPCFLDETFYEVSRDDIAAYIERRVEAGQVIGDDFVFVDLGAGDNGYWCNCRDCTTLLRKEGSIAAHILTWSNRLSEELNETYPGLSYGIFAYAGTNRPPKTMRPNKHIYVTYCFDFNCSEHPLDGSRCTRGDPSQGVDFGPHDNVTFAEHFLGWTDICDNVYVWYYGLPNSLLTMSYMHLVYDDWTWLWRSGAKGVYWEAEDTGYETNWVAKQLANQLIWDIDMSTERFSELYDRALYATYGDGAPLVRDYVTTIDRVHEASKCMNCWAFGLMEPNCFYSLYADPDGVAEHYDLMFELLEAAFPLATNARQEQRCAALEAGAIMKGSVAAYPKAQAAHDAERMAELSRRYTLMTTRLAKYGVDITNRSTLIGWSGRSHPGTIEELYPEGAEMDKYVSPRPFN